jgi:hypothetical protein
MGKGLLLKVSGILALSQLSASIWAGNPCKNGTGHAL